MLAEPRKHGFFTEHGFWIPGNQEDENDEQAKQQKEQQEKEREQILSQWEEEFSMFKWKRVVQGCVCFLFPIPFLLPEFGAPFGLSPERTTVFIPKTFLGLTSQVWPVEEREALMNTLEKETKETNVQFQVSDLTFRIVLSKPDDPIKL